MLKNHFVNSPVVRIKKKRLLQYEGMNGDSHLAPKVNFQEKL